MINNKYPTTKPSLNLDFANTKSLDPRITFRRGTPGTYYDGVTHAKAEENLLSYSEDFANAYWTKSNCSITSDSVDAPDGTVSAADKIVENTATSTHQLSVGAAGMLNETYTLSYFVKAAGRTSCRISFSGQGSAVFNISSGVVVLNEFISASINAVGNDWYRVSATVIKTNTNADIFIGPALDDGTLSYQGDGTSGIYLWGAQLEQRDTVTSYTATSGTPITKYQPKLMTAAADQARFDHDPLTGESKGLLIEEQRTNLIAYSQQIEQQTDSSSDFNLWVISSSSNGFIDLNASIAPDGTLSASKFYASSSLQSPAVYQLVYTTDTNPETLTFSVFAKAGQANRYLQLFSGSGDVDGDPFANFNLFDGTISRDDSSIASIEDHGNGWYRCIITFTTTSTSGVAINPVIYLIDDDNAERGPQMTGDSYSGIYVWGAQLETGSFPTSYIKTTGASATRSADNASITGENFSSWYRQDEGSIYSEASTSDFRSSYPRVMINDGSVSNRIVMSFFGAQGLRVASNGVQYIDASNPSSSDDGNYHKRAIGLKKDSFSFYTNGESVISDSAGEMPINVDRFAFYNNLSSNPADHLNGHIKKLAYYPQRLTNEQLQNLTK